MLIELVKKPCSISEVTATENFENPPRERTDACDGDTETFYHSNQSIGERNPFLTVSLNGTHVIKTITVVNVHTGLHCRDYPKHCTERINGAKVEVMSGLFKRLQ